VTIAVMLTLAGRLLKTWLKVSGRQADTILEGNHQFFIF
jgi:hypothetical protein